MEKIRKPENKGTRKERRTDVGGQGRRQEREKLRETERKEKEEKGRREAGKR